MSRNESIEKTKTKLSTNRIKKTVQDTTEAKTKLTTTTASVAAG